MADTFEAIDIFYIYTTFVNGFHLTHISCLRQSQVFYAFDLGLPLSFPGFLDGFGLFLPFGQSARLTLRRAIYTLETKRREIFNILIRLL